MNKKEILKKIEDSKKNPAKGYNSMGCSESNYDPYYLTGGCFKKNELRDMSKETLTALIKLADYASDVFY